MRNLNELDRLRRTDEKVIQMYGSVGDHTCGVFETANWGGDKILVIASSGGGWDHISVSMPHRCPTWEEMEMVKRLFFKDDEVAMQLHVPPKDHISVHPNALHIWRPTDVEIPLPPKEFVA